MGTSNRQIEVLNGEYIRVATLARKVKKTPQTIRRWIKLYNVITVSLGREKRIPLSELPKILRENVLNETE